MTDIPIIYSSSMVRALLQEAKCPGTGKTITRRLAYTERRKRNPALGESASCVVASPWQKAKAGDRLWVRENLTRSVERHWRYSADGAVILLQRADPRCAKMVSWVHHYDHKAAPSIHMPRWASRLTLIVTGTKTEPLQTISEEDAIAEGVKRLPARADGFGNEWVYLTDATVTPRRTAREAFADLWRSLHGNESWDENPLVVALGFRVIKANLDAPEAQAA